MGGAESFFENIEKNAHGLQEWKGELVKKTHSDGYSVFELKGPHR